MVGVNLGIGILLSARCRNWHGGGLKKGRVVGNAWGFGELRGGGNWVLVGRGFGCLDEFYIRRISYEEIRLPCRLLVSFWDWGCGLVAADLDRLEVLKVTFPQPTP